MIDEFTKSWVLKALNDLRVAGHKLERPEFEVVKDAVCFHCQQSVEKLLNAYLIFQNADFGKTHDLEYLVELCAEFYPDLENIEIGNLTYYAVEVRYPDDFYIPSIEEARECFDLATNVKELVFAQLRIDESDILP